MLHPMFINYPFCKTFLKKFIWVSFLSQLSASRNLYAALDSDTAGDTDEEQGLCHILPETITDANCTGNCRGTLNTSTTNLNLCNIPIYGPLLFYQK
jgi:hypothetical protein